VSSRDGMNGREKSHTYRDSISGPFSPKQVAIPTNVKGNNFYIQNLLNLKKNCLLLSLFVKAEIKV
jgi:hypothetical protein